MQKIIRSIFVLFLPGFFTVASAQLPPEIMVDKHLIEADQLHAKEDYAGAFKVMEKIIALQKEHNLTLPDAFHFKYARVAWSADSIKIAHESVNKYLSATGREGQFYREALALLLEVEGTEISAEEMCAGKPSGSSCWMELTNHPECYVWNDYYYGEQTVTWSGKCSGNLAHGEGTLTGAFTDGSSSITSTGHLQKGKRHGQWVVRWGPFWTEEGPYVEGKKHGQWVVRGNGGIFEGPYVEGKRHGQWVVRWEDRGTTEKGLYKEGKQHGQWVYSNPKASGDWGGLYVNGKRHGEWVVRSSDVFSRWGSYEEVMKGSYVDGEKHGQWVVREGNRVVKKETYVNGRLQSR